MPLLLVVILAKWQVIDLTIGIRANDLIMCEAIIKGRILQCALIVS